MKINKANFFLVLISSLSLSIAATYNGCSPLGTYTTSADGSFNVPGGSGSSGGGSNNGGSGSDNFVTSPGKAYFQTVLTDQVFKNPDMCLGCHGSPRERTEPVPTTITILYESYRILKKMLLDGSATNNEFYNMATNSNPERPHPGTNQCGIFGTAESPCKEFIEWYKLETNSNSAIPGTITTITPLGVATGWAADTEDPNRSVTVNFYAGDALIGSTVANQSGASGGFAGDHQYRFELPANIRDGTPKQISAFGVDNDGNEVELAGSPFQSVSYVPSQESINFFNNNIQGAFACGGCHVFDFNESFSRLLNPTPFDGGTRTNNRLYIYSTGGQGHAGGAACNGGCANDLQTWYDLSF